MLKSQWQQSPPNQDKNGDIALLRQRMLCLPLAWPPYDIKGDIALYLQEADCCVSWFDATNSASLRWWDVVSRLESG
jgi:hypothetical protein